MGDPLNDGMPRPLCTKVVRRLKGDLVVKTAKYEMIQESNKVLTDLGREKVTQA